MFQHNGLLLIGCHITPNKVACSVSYLALITEYVESLIYHGGLSRFLSRIFCVLVSTGMPSCLYFVFMIFHSTDQTQLNQIQLIR